MIICRQATRDDAPTIRRIRNECRNNFVNSKMISASDQETFWNQYVLTEKYRIWVICDDIKGKNIVGYYQARNFNAHACEVGLGIGKEYRRKGYGHNAMMSIRFRLLKMGIRKMWLEVMATNSAGILLFKKEGFEVCKEQNKVGIIRMERGTGAK